MFSLFWSDGMRSHTIVTNDAKTIFIMYSYFLRMRRGGHFDIRAIHVYDVSTGVELDPEEGLEPIKRTEDNTLIND